MNIIDEIEHYGWEAMYYSSSYVDKELAGTCFKVTVFSFLNRRDLDEFNGCHLDDPQRYSKCTAKMGMNVHAIANFNNCYLDTEYYADLTETKKQMLIQYILGQFWETSGIPYSLEGDIAKRILSNRSSKSGTKYRPVDYHKNGMKPKRKLTKKEKEDEDIGVIQTKKKGGSTAHDRLRRRVLDKGGTVNAY